MAKKGSTGKSVPAPAVTTSGRPSALPDTRVVYRGDNLEQLATLLDHCVDLIYTPAVSNSDPPFRSNRNYEVFWGKTKEKRSFEDRHAPTRAYIEYMRARCVQLARARMKTYHCDGLGWLRIGRHSLRTN
jgi:hypothetical protein